MWASNKDTRWINFIVQTFTPAADYSHIICLANIYFKISHTYPKYSIFIGTTKESLVLNLRHSGCEAWCCLASKSVRFKGYTDSRSSKLSDTKLVTTMTQRLRCWLVYMLSQTEHTNPAWKYLSRRTGIFLVFTTPSRAAHMHSCPKLLWPHTLHYEPEEEINFRRETETGFETKLDIWI